MTSAPSFIKSFTTRLTVFSLPGMGVADIMIKSLAVTLTLLATAAYLEILSVQATWYWYAGGIIAGMVVAYVATNGYDGLYEDLIKHLKGLTSNQ